VTNELPTAPRVFIVDDEWMIAESLAAILSRHGFQALPFHNPGQALVRAMLEPPDILLADVMMPCMSGTEMAVALRDAGHSTRILLFSGQDGAHERLREIRKRGYRFEFLQKPIHPMQLLLRLRNPLVSPAKQPEPAVAETAHSMPAA
jgi:DNA-binding response OmpR family regulator